MNLKRHWEAIYTAKQPTEVSWYQAEHVRSIELLREAGAGPETGIIDVGGGDSTFVDAVVIARLGRVTVLDISAVALERARARLGSRAGEVIWLEADVTRAVIPAHAFDVWHDRAVFHFLTQPDDRARYVAAAEAALRPGGTLLISTFALDGPLRCSGLEVVRYSAEDLSRALGNAFVLERDFVDIHRTPSGKEQRFTVAVFQRR